MTESLWILALLVTVGIVGAFLIVRYASGAGTLFGCVFWLAAPFVLIAVMLAAEYDASLLVQRSSNNFSFGLVLISIIVAVPWFLSSIVGGVFGLFFKKKPPPDPEDAPTIGPSPDSGLPASVEADQPAQSDPG